MVIWGWRTYVQQLVMLTLVCQQCQNPAAHNLHKRITKFTLFFIPLFPLSRKFGLQCTFCGVAYDIDKTHAEQLLASAQQQPQTYPQQTHQPHQH
ncbi:zinc-ribbon domain-containing protein [Lentzea tibetensis]|uniref:Zinc-ribbon domain-containing protein n=1 Tax=Lentzea tibetensis TaxID=2591470 RepID=A0A563F0U4_9PSEU|nr:zinc-ribbon domain-containing protein [Lentzea tibetensis]TWP53381.1 zinc-ribbon domain-containing protein [Lentzea tibetensis]